MKKAIALLLSAVLAAPLLPAFAQDDKAEKEEKAAKKKPTRAEARERRRAEQAERREKRDAAREAKRNRNKSSDDK